MRYDTAANRISVTAAELVSLGLDDKAPLSYGLDRDAADRAVCVGGTPMELYAERGALRYLVTARAEAEDCTVTLRFSLPSTSPIPSPDTERQTRGEGFVAAYVLAAKRELDRVTLRTVYTAGEAEHTTSEEVSWKRLSTFFYQLLDTLATAHAEELDRVVRRLPTMAAAKYPFPSLREGQEEFISAAYRTMRKGQRLYVCAPTGIGKTMSALYPAVRAMGEGVFEKIFYFTSKHTGAQSAMGALDRLAETGVKLRGVELLAREKLCQRGLLCRADTPMRCGAAYGGSAMREAVSHLLALEKATVTAEDLQKEAKESGVCPYTLAQRYASLSDVVICDYNYLFDPSAYSRRFFSERGPWCLLVDEAHNLADRATASYSAELSPHRLRQMGETLGGDHARLFTLAADGIETAVDRMLTGELKEDRDGQTVGFFSSSDLPAGITEVVGELAEQTLSLTYDKQTPAALSHRALRMGQELTSLVAKLRLYGRGFVTFYERKGETRRLRSVCLDPSEPIRERLSLGESAVLFSATLHPIEYYRDLLGGDRGSATLSLPSPFSPSQFALTVMDKIPVGYSSREGSLLSVVRVILTTVRAHPGNYMVFCPSFAYLDALGEAIAKAVPGLPLLRQTRQMTEVARRDFLAAFSTDRKQALVGLCVLGGIYGEGVDLVGDRLIGAVIVGVGMPTLSDEREAQRAYFEDRYEMGTAYAYAYPGIGRVLQAAGRVIRDEADRGVLVLVDERYAAPAYREMLPAFWHHLKYAGDLPSLEATLRGFWAQERP